MFTFDFGTGPNEFSKNGEKTILKNVNLIWGSLGKIEFADFISKKQYTCTYFQEESCVK